MMNRKFYNIMMTVVTVVLVCASFSCKRNNVKRIKTDNKFAIQLLADDTITVYDALGIMDSAWRTAVFIDEDDVLHYMYEADTAKNVISGEELLNKIDDIEIDVSSDIEIPDVTVPNELYEIRELIAGGGGVPPAPFSYEFKLDTTLLISDFPGLPFAIENFTIAKVMMKTGSIGFVVDVDGLDESLVQFQITLMSQNIIDSDGPFSFTVSNHGNVLKDLTECAITPVNDTVGLQASVRIMMPSIVINENTALSQLDAIIYAVENIGGICNVNLRGDISDQSLKSVEGRVNVPSVRFGGVAEDLSFDIDNLTGDLEVNKPHLIIKYLNNFGFGANAKFDTMCLHTKEGTDMSIMKTESISFDVEKTSSYNDLDVTGELIDYIDVFKEYERFTYSGEVGISNQDAIGVYEYSHIDVATFMSIKLGMKVNELMYCDTVDMDMGDDVTIQNYLDEIDFKFNLTNGLPVELEFQAYLMENGVVTDSLFDETNNKIPSSFGGDPVSKTSIVVATEERLDNVLNADKLIYKIRLTTTGCEVVFRSKDMIVVGVSILTKTNEIDLDNVL
ncbi:MAG: hypothetical protein MJ000_03705 [Bacteroidales bacterium]|nr:hypothetical protein [Bacteroidales bacterium]